MDIIRYFYNHNSLISRMSQQIKKNMLREALSNKYQEDEQDMKSTDVKITRNQEIHMGNDQEDNELQEEKF